MTEWTDGRLDELSKRVDDGFAEVNRRFARVETRLERLEQILIRMAWTYGIGMLGFAAALLGLIATKF